MSKYKCLNCGHEFEAKKDTQDLSKPRQCSKCWSWFVIPLEEYENCKAQTLEMMAKTTAGLIPIWDIIVTVFTEQGIRLTPRFTLRLCTMLYNDIKKEKGWVL
jgi:DNA-directed RNA polymerase subunit RPC12/RpoP